MEVRIADHLLRLCSDTPPSSCSFWCPTSIPRARSMPLLPSLGLDRIFLDAGTGCVAGALIPDIDQRALPLTTLLNMIEDSCDQTAVHSQVFFDTPVMRHDSSSHLSFLTYLQRLGTFLETRGFGGLRQSQPKSRTLTTWWHYLWVCPRSRPQKQTSSHPTSLRLTGCGVLWDIWITCAKPTLSSFVERASIPIDGKACKLKPNTPCVRTQR